MNPCRFSPCRRYRYTLTHDVADLFSAPSGHGYVAWIGLNPSRADESRLDPTLWRVRAYTNRFGFRAFKMLNLFAYRAPDPRVLKRAADPVGPENDHHLLEVCRQAALVVCCWGAGGQYRDRDRAVIELLRGIPLHALALSKMGHPRHPLYLKGTCWPMPFAGSLAIRCAAVMAGVVRGKA
ncbi:MAG: DUF1643 domain-containing protein [Verrucomicrobia bacterium]|nr:DUF1643 domain-containing protein [Verrucomicrobiota bacterium]